VALRIAFVGRHQSGKTYAAHYLYKHHGFKTVKMQDGVTKMLRYFYKYRSHERINWEKRLAFYDALYILDNDIHIDYLLRRLATSTTDIVIDDVRYINEVQKLREAGFIIIRISMPTTTKIKLKGIKTAAPGSIKLNEYFNRTFEAYSTDYSIINENRNSLYRLLDSIITKEREKRG
jgi:ethanolamine utilization protein EutP (predicted NTPase)